MCRGRGHRAPTGSWRAVVRCAASAAFRAKAAAACWSSGGAQERPGTLRFDLPTVRIQNRRGRRQSRPRRVSQSMPDIYRADSQASIEAPPTKRGSSSRLPAVTPRAFGTPRRERKNLPAATENRRPSRANSDEGAAPGLGGCGAIRGRRRRAMAREGLISVSDRGAVDHRAGAVRHGNCPKILRLIRHTAAGGDEPRIGCARHHRQSGFHHTAWRTCPRRDPKIPVSQLWFAVGLGWRPGPGRVR